MFYCEKAVSNAVEEVEQRSRAEATRRECTLCRDESADNYLIRGTSSDILIGSVDAVENDLI